MISKWPGKWFGVTLLLTVIVSISYILVLLNLPAPAQPVANQKLIAIEYNEGQSSPRQGANDLNAIYFEIFQEEELKEFFLDKTTKRWRGEVDNIKYNGFDERIHGSKNFYLSQNKEFKEFLSRR